MTNFYEILGVHQNSSNDEITKAYKERAKEYHPDKNNGVQAAEAMFKLVGLAKDTLLDPKKRLEHDYRCGFKEKPISYDIPKAQPVQNNQTGQLLGWGLLGLIIGMAIGNSNK